jgi:hypothetical protein
LPLPGSLLAYLEEPAQDAVLANAPGEALADYVGRRQVWQERLGELKNVGHGRPPSMTTGPILQGG